jgi:hypothetical protein
MVSVTAVDGNHVIDGVEAPLRDVLEEQLLRDTDTTGH